MILLGPYLDRSYSAAGKTSGRLISCANWMMRIGCGQNSRGMYLPPRRPPLPMDLGEEGESEEEEEEGGGEGGSRVNLASRSSHAERVLGQSRRMWKRHRCTSGSTRYLVERRRTPAREEKEGGRSRECRLEGVKYLFFEKNSSG
jgi:hypothetical protein